MLSIKPPIPRPRINWSNPLTRGLVAVFVCNEGAGSLLNLVDMRTKLTLVNSGAWTKGGIGLALNCSLANDSGAWNTAPPSSMQPANAVSIFWQGKIMTTPTGFAPIAQMSYTNSDVAPFTSYGINVDTTGTKYTFWGYNTGTAIITVSPNVAFNGTERQLLGTTISGTQVLYENGIKIGSGVTTYANIGYSANCEFGIGVYQSAQGRNSQTKCSLCFVWNRVVSAQEANLLYINPLQIFAKPILSPMNTGKW